MGTHSRVTIYSSYIYVYFDRINGVGHFSSSLKRLAIRMHIEGKDQKQVYNWVSNQFKGNFENLVELDNGWVMKVDVANWVPGVPRGDKGESFKRYRDGL